MKKLAKINEKVIVLCYQGMTFTDALEKARSEVEKEGKDER